MKAQADDQARPGEAPGSGALVSDALDGHPPHLLRLTVGLLSLIPIVAGAAGVLLGPAMLGVTAPATDLDSHFRYLSGIFLGVGLVFMWTAPAVERRSAGFRLAAGLVITGGLARLLSLVVAGQPSLPHLLGLVMELGVVPLLVFWQSRVARTG